MLVVFGTPDDSAAQRIAEAWEPWGGALCTPADLSKPGWRHWVGREEPGTAVVAGRVVQASEIERALIRFPAVQPTMLPIAPEDREYVAREMTAFLIAFVLALRCVLNRPSANGLSGPAWRPEQWIRAAAKAGIPVQPRQRSIAPHRPAEPEVSGDIELTVIGGQVFGAAEAPLAEWALSLANVTGAGLLGLGFNRQL